MAVEQAEVAIPEIQSSSRNSPSDLPNLDSRLLRRTPAVIEVWLLHWPQLYQASDSRFSWAEMRMDILHAVNQIPIPKVRRFFDLYCAYGYEYSEIAKMLECSLSSVRSYWRILRREVRRNLTDTGIRDRPRITEPLSESQRIGAVGPWDLPLQGHQAGRR